MKIRTATKTKATGPAAKLAELEAGVNACFVERDHLTKAIVLALVTRQHVLVHGGHGTAKSRLVAHVFGALSGELFTTQFSEALTEDFVIGPPNVARLQKEGVIEHNTAGMLPEAEFAYLEELMDANAGLLRGTLLTILNERVFLRGAQRLECPLWTAVATTNFYKADDAKLAAVLDRFLCHVKVGDISEDAGVEQMLCNHIEGTLEELPSITKKELEELHDTMQRVSIDISLVQLFMLLLKEVAKASGAAVYVSDRRKCQALDLMRASAALAGRAECNEEDLDAVRHGIVCVGDEQQDQWFDTALLAAKAAYAANREYADMDQVIRKTLEKAEREFTASKTDAKKLGDIYAKVALVSDTIAKRQTGGKLPQTVADAFARYAARAKELGDKITEAFEKAGGTK